MKALALPQRLPLPVKDMDGEGPLKVALHHRSRGTGAEFD